MTEIVVDNIVNVLKLLMSPLNVQARVVSPGQDELTDLRAIDHLAKKNHKPETS